MTGSSTFDLGDHFAAFINTMVAEGRFASASDVVLAGLRLLEQKERELSALRAALLDGEMSGPASAFGFDAFLARKRALPTTDSGQESSKSE